jgi:hypothetical protein
VTQIVDEHGDVIAALRFEHSLETKRFEGGAGAREQLPRVDGLREVRVRPLAQARLDRVRFSPRRREHDDRGASGSPCAQLVQHFNAIHARHRYVEKNELRLVLFDHAERLVARRSRPDLVPLFGQKRFVESPCVGKVVHDEDVAARRIRPRRGRVRRRGVHHVQDRILSGRSVAPRGTSRRGRTRVKVDPSFSVERTSISPPRARARRLESTSPMPVPG